MNERVLLIVHQEHSEPGRVGRMLAERGCTLDLRRPACGCSLPESAGEHDAVVVFGGPMSANDDPTMPFLGAEMRYIDKVLDAGKPFLGICLGGQMLSRCLGGRVGPHPEGYSEIGYYGVRPTAAGRPLFPAEQRFYQWHSEGFSVPDCCELLATGEHFENQAFRCGNAYGIQFHPEVTRAMMLRWTAKAAHRMVLPGAQSRDMHLEGHAAFDADVERWLGSFFDAWLPGSRAQAAYASAAD